MDHPPAPPTCAKPRRSPDIRRKEKRAKLPNLSDDERRRLRNKVMRVTCSEQWEDISVKEADAQGINPRSPGRVVGELLEKYGIYPPPPDLLDNLHGAAHRQRKPVRMKCCDLCSHKFPPQYVVETRILGVLVRFCTDCAMNDPIDDVLRTAHEKSTFRRQEVYSELRKVGLTDREISALSLSHEGHSIRMIAGFCKISRARVWQVLRSAREKIAKSGLKIERDPDAQTPRIKLVDPRLMAQCFAA